MRFRPANISLINRRHYLPRLLLTLSSKYNDKNNPQRFADIDRSHHINCRGRDDPHGSPPAQIRTSASTHTALLKNEWRRANPDCGLLHAHRPNAGTCKIPALSQEHVRLNDVLLQLRPSLPNLRRSCRLLVRLVHRYYGAVRLLQHVHVRRVAYHLHGPTFANCRRCAGDLPVLVHVVFLACAGS
jgi:hypothetical protein